ncbi:unnamed protein product [Rhizopus stolonifer]
MTIICTICISDLHLTSLLRFPVVIINSWINSVNERNNSPHCPLCKELIHNRNNPPLFFSFNDSVEAEAHSSIEDKLLIAEFKDKKRRVEQENKSLILQLRQERENSDNLRQELGTLRRVEEEHNKKIRYLKQLKRVSDIDEYMAQPTTQAYLQNVTRLPRAELVVVLGGLRGRCAQAAKERDIAVKRHTSAEDREERLRRKIKKLTGELNTLKNTGSAKPKSSNPTNFIQYGQPHQYRKIIVVDSDEEHEEKEVIHDENRGLASDDDIYYTEDKGLTSDEEVVRSDVGASGSHKKSASKPVARQNTPRNRINNNDNGSDGEEYITSSDESNSGALFTLTNESGIPESRQLERKRQREDDSEEIRTSTSRSRLE